MNFEKLKLRGKKGQGGIGIALIFFIILAFVSLLFIGIIGYFFNELTTEIISIPSRPNETVNMSKVGADTFGQVNAALISQSKIIALVILFSMVFAMLIVEYFSRKHPAFFILDLFVLILAFIFSVFISNRYGELMSGQVFSSNLVSMKAASSIMLNLPLWVTIIGLSGMVLSFIGIIKRRGSEEFR